MRIGPHNVARGRIKAYVKRIPNSVGRVRNFSEERINSIGQKSQSLKSLRAPAIRMTRSPHALFQRPHRNKVRAGAYLAILVVNTIVAGDASGAVHFLRIQAPASLR
jgi:hypothetical protein